MVALKEQVLSFGGAHEVLAAHMAPTSTVYSFPVNIFTDELCTCAPGPPCWLELRSRHARRNIRGDTHHRGLRRIFRLPQTSNHSVLARICTHEEGRRITLPKAQQARGLTSVHQSNFLRSYHKFLHKSWSFTFRISTMHQLLVAPNIWVDALGPFHGSGVAIGGRDMAIKGQRTGKPLPQIGSPNSNRESSSALTMKRWVSEVIAMLIKTMRWFWSDGNECSGKEVGGWPRGGWHVTARHEQIWCGCGCWLRKWI